MSMYRTMHTILHDTHTISYKSWAFLIHPYDM